MASELVGRGWAFPPMIDLQGGLAITNDWSEINQAVTIILTTAIGERVMRSTFGSRLHELIYEPINGPTLALAEEYVRDALGMWEPRIELTNVRASRDTEHQGRILIDIDYEIKPTHDRRSLVHPFYIIPERE